MRGVLKRCPECNAAHVPEGKARCTPCENGISKTRAATAETVGFSHRQMRNTAACGPKDDVGEAVRHIFNTDEEAEAHERYKAAVRRFAGTVQRGELKIRVWGISFGAPPQQIEENVRRYYAELTSSDDQKRRRRKGPGFEFL